MLCCPVDRALAWDKRHVLDDQSDGPFYLFPPVLRAGGSPAAGESV